VVSSLVTESEQIESERQQVRTLELLARNIDQSASHEIRSQSWSIWGFRDPLLILFDPLHRLPGVPFLLIA